MQSPILLGKNSTVTFPRRFHVETLRGGMNRLLLRALPTEENTSRIEILFQYVQYLQIPMGFDGLEIFDATSIEPGNLKYRDLLRSFPTCRIFELTSKGEKIGDVIAAACSYGEDSPPNGSQSMFPMMG